MSFERGELSRRNFIKSAVPALVAPARITKGLVLSSPTIEPYGFRGNEDGSFELKSGSSAWYRFLPKFCILYRDKDPNLKIELDHATAFRVPTWDSVDGGSRTMDLFTAGHSKILTSANISTVKNHVRWHFPSDPSCSLEAALTIPTDSMEPRLTFRFTSHRKGWFSVGFVGAPEVDPDNIDSVWQPLVWQEKRFPAVSYLSMQHMCPIPEVLVSAHGDTLGVAADPRRLSFALPTFLSSQFGLLVRNAHGKAQPSIFSPVLGLKNSELEEGATIEFSLLLLVRHGNCQSAFQHSAQKIYKFKDYRENATCSLNDTLDNLIDLALDDYYSGWVPRLKGFVYMDVKDTVKNVSALHPLSVAIIRDSVEIYLRRALPIIEYMMSRQKYNYAGRPDIKRQSASHLMKGPCAEVSELAALFSMTSGRSSVFAHYAEELYRTSRELNLNMVSRGDSWQNSLALYRMSDDHLYLDKAKRGANSYILERIETPQRDFSDVHISAGGQFWTDFAPTWIDLLELYEETRDSRYLDAASKGASLYANYVWLQPPIPKGSVVANKGGVVTTHRTKMVPEERVPAWRVSAVGLTPEASTTYDGNPAVLLTHYAAYMLRMAFYTGDSFYKDIARSAVVGRYCNYPGYTIKGGPFTTIYQRSDFPLHPLLPGFPGDWTDAVSGYATFYYNHIFPQIVLLLDYLISEAYTRSESKISFPSRYAPGYAYLQSKVYGDRPGTFYGHSGVRLWMPRQALRLDNLQINYLTCYGNGNFYFALMNQSARPCRVTVTLHPDTIPVDVEKRYRVGAWEENRPSTPVYLENGKLTARVAGVGLTGLVIEGLEVKTRFQRRMAVEGAVGTSPHSFQIIDSPFGKITAMLISMGESLTSAYVWLEASEEQLREATLEYTLGDQRVNIRCPQYPFEFTILLGENVDHMRLRVEGLTPDGRNVSSSTVELKSG
jgi:hypothetical protein